jgi:uncharacterized protein YbjT (DUF2867 family)
MKIVVTTPTGRVGSRVVRLLVQGGVRPTLLLRDAGRLDDEVRARVDAVEGDQRDADVVLHATAGADALYWVNPPTDEHDPVAAQQRMADIVARAVSENEISRTVFQSSIGAEKRTGAGDIDGLAAVEVALDRTGASVTHLRCGFFFTNLQIDPGMEEGVFRIAVPVDRPMAWVDPRDVADVAAARLLNADWSGRNVQAVHGPEHLSWQQAIAIVADATGRRLRVEQVPDDDIRAALRSAGMSDKQAEAIMGMSTGLREHFVPEDDRTILTTTPTTLGAWAHSHLRGDAVRYE